MGLAVSASCRRTCGFAAREAIACLFVLRMFYVQPPMKAAVQLSAQAVVQLSGQPAARHVLQTLRPAALHAAERRSRFGGSVELSTAHRREAANQAAVRPALRFKESFYHLAKK